MPAPKLGEHNAITPDPGVWENLSDNASPPALMGASALPASGAWRNSQVFSVAAADELSLGIFYDAAAGTTTGYPEVRVRLSNAGSPPATGDDEWVEITLRDDLAQSPAALTGTLGTGIDESSGPLRLPLVVRGLALRTMAATANSDKIREGWVIKVRAWRHCQVCVHEKGDTANPGTCTIKASLVA